MALMYDRPVLARWASVISSWLPAVCIIQTVCRTDIVSITCCAIDYTTWTIDCTTDRTIEYTTVWLADIFSQHPSDLFTTDSIAYQHACKLIILINQTRFGWMKFCDVLCFELSYCSLCIQQLWSNLNLIRIWLRNQTSVLDQIGFWFHTSEEWYIEEICGQIAKLISTRPFQSV